MEETAMALSSSSDLCQQLMDRYKASSAKQHRHLLATAAAMSSVISSESLPLSPTAYFAASISAVSQSSQTLDSDAVGALTSLLSLALPLIPPQGISSEKAVEAVEVLVQLLNRRGDDGGLVSASSVRAVVKCLGILVGFCDSSDWNSLQLGFETLLKFSIDKCPKVRKSAQMCVEKIFTSFQDPSISQEASNLMAKLFKTYMHSVVELGNLKSFNGPKVDIPSKPVLVEALHLLNVLKIVFPYLSIEVGSKILRNLLKLMQSDFSALTRHILIITEAYLTDSKFKSIIQPCDKILVSFAAYLTSANKKPLDTEKAVVSLLKQTIDRLNHEDQRLSITQLPVAIGSITGCLTSEISLASHATIILKELITEYLDQPNPSYTEIQQFKDDGDHHAQSIMRICQIFEDAVQRYEGDPNEKLLEVVSVLFLKLGITSYIFMKGILCNLANLMSHSNGNDKSHLQHCIGAAVIAMGPEKMLTILPISLHSEDFTCSNTWLIPILRKYVAGASLGFYMEHVMPLADTLQQACRRVKSIVIRKDLKAHARSLRALLTAFCRQPRDARQNIGTLGKMLLTFIKEDPYMHETVAAALQELLNQEKRCDGDVDEFSCVAMRVFQPDHKSQASFSLNAPSVIATGLATITTDLLEALTDLFVISAPEKGLYIQNAIGCLASVADPSSIKRVFLATLEKFQTTNDVVDKEKEYVQRCRLLELTSSFSKGADKALLRIIYDFIKCTLKGNVEAAHGAAFSALSIIIQEHGRFSSKRLSKIVDLIYNLKSPTDMEVLQGRFKVLHALLVLLVKGNLEEDNTKAFLILNEMILKMKDSNEEVRKVAYDTLLAISSSLRDPASSSLDKPYETFITMVTGYLSGSSPHIKSGAISALSILLYKDPQLCILIPDVLPAVLSLLQKKVPEVIKAVLGFVKVLVSCLQVKDLQTLLPDIANGILPWSSVSRNHFRTKITIIMEIIIRKCGSVSIQSVVPSKYEGFLKTIIQSRHGKINSDEVERNENFSDDQSETPERRKRKRPNFKSSDGSGKTDTVAKGNIISKEPHKSTWTRKATEGENKNKRRRMSDGRNRRSEQNPKFTKRKSFGMLGSRRRDQRQ